MTSFTARVYCGHGRYCLPVWSVWTDCILHELGESRLVYRLVGLVVKASASRAEDPGFESRLRRDFFRGRVIPVT